MKVEQTKNEIVIRIPITFPTESVQELVDYLQYWELTAPAQTPSQSQPVQQVVDEISRGINKEWWNNNKDQFGGDN